MSSKIKAKDILLLLLYLPGKNPEINEPIVGRTRITKMMFLFEKELLKNFNNISLDSLPEFFAYNYGPFSKELLDDIRFFQAINFIKEDVISDGASSEEEVGEYVYDIYEDLDLSNEIAIEDVGYPGETQFYLTDKGIKFVEDKLLSNDQFTDDQLQILKMFKKKINTQSLNQILTYVYKKYEEMTTNSYIRDKILG